MVQVKDLKRDPPYGELLYCPGCGGEFSAYKGDYFLLLEDHVFECGECGESMELVTRRVVYEPVPLRGEEVSR